MQKVAKMQAKVNALKHGDTAAMGTIETVLLIIGVVVVVSVLFMFLVTKLKGSVDGVDKDMEAAKSYIDGNEITPKA